MQLVVPKTFYNVYKLHFHKQGKKNFDKFFDKSVINRTGFKSGFKKRKSGKISACHFVLGFVLMCCKGKNTFSEWALQIGWLCGKTISKQVVFERLQKGAAVFAEQLLQYVMLRQSKLPSGSPLFGAFGNYGG